MQEHQINLKNNFIDGYYLPNLSVCDDLINFFESSGKKQLGQVGNGYVNAKVKDSTDLELNPNDIVEYQVIQDYFKQLSKIIDLYKRKYKFCTETLSQWGLHENFGIQKYTPTQAYHGWHCESANIFTSKRHLVFMTYLNDVKKGGETEWYYQNVKIKPEKGLTVIWSADWTFTHKGNTTFNENKYIITGWYEFKE